MADKVDLRTGSASPSTPHVQFPFLDLRAQFAGIRDEVMQAVTRVMESQQFIMGEEVDSLERELAELLQVQFAVSCASGTDALWLALRALDIGPGDEVITVPFTFVATAGMVARTGARPVFVDIEPGTFNIDPGLIRSAITPKTRAIIPVHLFGLPADMEPILKLARDHKLAVVEDAAQAIGARYRGQPVGGQGTLGCFSFFPSKNLGGAGDGGLVVTNDEGLADRLRLLRAHGGRDKYNAEVLGTNSRLDALQAAILRVKLRHLADWNAARQKHAAGYRALFHAAGLEQILTLPHAPDDCVHVFNQFTIRCPHRDELRKTLQARSIPSDVYYPVPLHLQRAYAYLGYRQGQFPVSERAAREVLSLPCFPEMRDAQQRAVAEAIRDFYQPLP